MHVHHSRSHSAPDAPPVAAVFDLMSLDASPGQTPPPSAPRSRLTSGLRVSARTLAFGLLLLLKERRVSVRYHGQTVSRCPTHELAFSPPELILSTG